MIVELPDEYRATLGTSAEQDTGVVIDYAADGTSYSRALMPWPHYMLDVRWSARSRAQHDALVLWLAEHRQAEMLLELDGVTYRCRPAGNLRVQWDYGASVADCSMRFRGLRHE